MIGKHLLLDRHADVERGWWRELITLGDLSEEPLTELFCPATPVAPEGPPEVDVTRVQMFFFTIISAGFVLIKIFLSYKISEIPNGYIELMGISNGVYLTKKYFA